MAVVAVFTAISGSLTACGVIRVATFMQPHLICDYIVRDLSPVFQNVLYYSAPAEILPHELHSVQSENLIGLMVVWHAVADSGSNSIIQFRHWRQRQAFNAINATNAIRQFSMW